VRIRFHVAAENDLDDIWHFIALDDPKEATKLVDAIGESLNALLTFPGAGRKRDDLAPGLRSWPVAYPYIVFYMVTKSELQIARILHGSRDLPKLFDPAFNPDD